MKKTIALLSIASVLFLGACKKDKHTDPETETETPVTPSEEQTNGSLTIITQKYIGTSPIPDQTSATAFFYEDYKVPNYIKVDSVMVNGVGLTFQPFANIYQSYAIMDVTKANWEVKGNNGIPSFTYANNTGMPAYTGYGVIPDNIPSSKDYTLTLTGLSKTDLYIVTIYDGNGTQLRKSQLDAKITSITFPASELSTLDTDAVIQVTILNNHFESVGGKRFSIQNEANYFKEITIN